MGYLILQIVASAAMAALGAWAARRSRLLATILCAPLMLLILLKAAAGHLPAAEPTLFSWDWYPYVEPTWYLVPAMFLLGAGVVTVWRSRVKRDLLLIGAGVLMARTGAAAWAAPRPHDLTGTANDAGVCLQTSGYSCAAAASVSFLYYYGIRTTEREMAELCVTRCGGPGLAGTSDAGLLRGLRRMMKGRMTVQIARVRYEEISTPALVTVEIAPGLGHCLMVWRVDPELVHLLDPRCGRVTWSRSAFERMWTGSAIWAE